MGVMGVMGWWWGGGGWGGGGVGGGGDVHSCHSSRDLQRHLHVAMFYNHRPPPPPPPPPPPHPTPHPPTHPPYFALS